MSVTLQIVTGTLVLLVCSGLQIVLLAAVIRHLSRMHLNAKDMHLLRNWVWPTASAFLAVVVGHTAHVWLWATSFIVLGALAAFPDALYFSLVTYTTVGYGDVTVGPDYRLYAAMAAVTGLFNFGLSTAFLVGLFTRLLQRNTDNGQDQR